MTGEVEAHHSTIGQIEHNMDAAERGVDENTRLLQAREISGTANYWGYYWVIIVESVVLVMLLYIGL